MHSPPAMPVVLDTNVVLDLWVFDDAAAAPLRQALQEGRLQCLATGPLRDELARVLAYPQIAKSLAFRGRTAAQVLAWWDALALLQPVATKAPVTCKDPDDQKFIDLAVAHRALLLSKDHAVLCMRKRLAALGVSAQTAI